MPFGEAFGSTLGSEVAKALIPSSTATNTYGAGTTTQKGTTTSGKQLSQQAIDKLIYDVMSADSGLASLATGENLSGGYGASTKALLAQDFMVKVIGELANVTAQTVQTIDQTQETKTEQHSKSKKKASVICTELVRQGLLAPELYNNSLATNHFLSLPKETILGYQLWATYVVLLMSLYPWIAKVLAPVAAARYRMIISGEWNLVGWITLVPGQWICSKIGTLFCKNREVDYGYIS